MESNILDSCAKGDSGLISCTKGPDGSKSDPAGDGMESNELATGVEGDPDDIGNATDGAECECNTELDNKCFQFLPDNSTNECFYPTLKSLGISIDLSIPDNHDYVKKLLGELISLHSNFHTSTD